MWATLVPVLVGGVLALAGGFVGPWLLEGRRETSDKKKKREAKLEELVAALYEHKHWLGVVRKSRVFGGDEESMSPFAKIQAIATVHFPTLLPKLEELETAVDAYEIWMLGVGQDRLKNGTTNIDGHIDAYRPYITKFNETREVLKAYAKTEFQ